MSEDSKDIIPKYNKDEVISLAKGNGSFFVDDRALHKWLNNIIEFLNSSRAQSVLEWNEKGYRGDYFLNEEMNINHSRSSEAKKEYNYNIITAITLSVLLLSYEDDYFQALLKGEYVEVEQGEGWIDELEKNIEYFEDHWNEKLEKGILVEINGKKSEEKKIGRLLALI